MKKRKSFTLLEIVVVVAIIGMIAGIMVKNLIGVSSASQQDMARASIKNLSETLKIYRIHKKKYPSTDEGLEELTKGGESAYLESLPLDPWGNEFVYNYPSQRDGKYYDLYSLGEDGQEGGEGFSEDISN
ncbi:MAG: type II secretion system major pseudopilin GspG [Planctomycetes bacterium]|nr:type II secretion system major pseudopilin GspG [Planctomycetota bacterium]